MSTREQLEKEAAELYPADLDDCGCCPCFCSRCLNARQDQKAFIAGRTINAEQVFLAALEANATLCQHVQDGLIDIEVFHEGIELERAMIRAGFRAAGFYVEEKET